MMIYDTHMHTSNSDGSCSVDEMCISAIEKGVAGIAITDHANISVYELQDTLNKIKKCLSEIQCAKEKYKNKLQLSSGVELGEYLYAPEKAREILSLTDYDVILCSIHHIYTKSPDKFYSQINYSENISDEEINSHLSAYFDLLSETIDSFDFDILAHITCPVRYITGRHKRKTDVMIFKDKIEEILSKVISRNIALEYNTTALNDKSYNHYDCQHYEVFKLYGSMGGKLVTIGSDTHSKNHIGGNFDVAKEQLKSLGFEKYVFYENRQPIEFKL